MTAETGLRPNLLKFLLGAVLLIVSLLLGLNTSPGPPADVEEALFAYWASLPSPAGFEQQITHSWRGVTPVDNPAGLPPQMEIWCVETRISAPDEPLIDGEQLTWIVVRENRAAPWQTALLATLSSLWPYEACGRGF